MKQLPGDKDGKYLICTDGIQFEVLEPTEIHEETGALFFVPPKWTKLCWLLKDDPRTRPDWNRVVGYKPEKFEKLSKSDQ